METLKKIAKGYAGIAGELLIVYEMANMIDEGTPVKLIKRVLVR